MHFYCEKLLVVRSRDEEKAGDLIDSLREADDIKRTEGGGGENLGGVQQSTPQVGRAPNVSVNSHYVYEYDSAIGCHLFDERIGCFNDPPPTQACEFIDSMSGFFKYQQLLMYGLPIYKIFPTRVWTVYEAYCDRLIEQAEKFVVKVTVEEAQLPQRNSASAHVSLG